MNYYKVVKSSKKEKYIISISTGFLILFFQSFFEIFFENEIINLKILILISYAYCILFLLMIKVPDYFESKIKTTNIIINNKTIKIVLKFLIIILFVIITFVNLKYEVKYKKEYKNSIKYYY